MTWWRQSRDASGMTIVGRLELIDGNCLTNMANCGYDEYGCALYLAISHHRKRIRSILRRLKRCVKCHGTGKNKKRGNKNEKEKAESMVQDGRRISANPQTTNGTGKKAKQNNTEGPSVSNGTASFVCSYLFVVGLWTGAK